MSVTELLSNILDLDEYFLPGTYIYPISVGTPMSSHNQLSWFVPAATSAVSSLASLSDLQAMPSFDNLNQGVIYDVINREGRMSTLYVYNELPEVPFQQTCHTHWISAFNDEDQEVTTRLEQQKPLPETKRSRKRVYQAEQGYLVEEPSSEPSEEG